MTYPIKLDTLLIELADFCNLKCIMCDMSEEGRLRHGHPSPEQSIHGTQGRFLPFSSFRGIIDSINQSELKAGVISLFWLGEPMINSEIGKMLDYLSNHMENIDGWMLHTNGQILNEGTLRLMFESKGNNLLHFSVDAASPEVYGRVRRGGNYQILLENIRKALDLRREYPQSGLKLVLQFIVMEENKHEARPFLDFWGNEFRKRGLKFSIARNYSQHGQNTLFIRQEIATPSLQAKANEMHQAVADATGVPK